MKIHGKILFVVVNLLLLAAGCLGSKNTSTEKTVPVATVVVIMKDDKYEPENITIKKNIQVVFKNLGNTPNWPASNLHPTHGLYPEFDPLKGVEHGQEWSFVFDKVGSWKYHNHLNPSIRGIINVVE